MYECDLGWPGVAGSAGGPDLVLALPRALGMESGGELPHITTDHCHIAIITSVNCVKLRFCDFCWSDFTAYIRHLFSDSSDRSNQINKQWIVAQHLP